MSHGHYIDYISKALLGFIIYVITVIEVVYVMLRVFDGDVLYQTELGNIVINSLSLRNANPYVIIQSIFMGPFVISSLGLVIIPILIALTNTLITIYAYRLVKARGLGLGIALPIIITAMLNPYTINSMTNPWLPQSISMALGIMLYYYMDANNVVVSTVLSGLLSLLSPYSSILAILIPITHGAINRRFNSSNYYALTLGLMAVVYYYIANAIPIMITPTITVQNLLNNLIESLASTAFLQLTFLDTGIIAIISSLISSISVYLILPPILVVTLIEALSRLKESRLAWLTLTVTLIMASLLTAISPLWPVLNGTGVISNNWMPISNSDAMVYSLVGISPRGSVGTPAWASLASLLLRPGINTSSYVMPIASENGTYAICGDYELVLNNYSGITKINDLSLVISPDKMNINTNSYIISNDSLTILSGAYQSSFNITSIPIELPPGRYSIYTIFHVTEGRAIYNVTKFGVFAIRPSGGVLPIGVSSTVLFPIYINETVLLTRIILYGVSYTNNEAIVMLRIIRNNTVVYIQNSTAPSITSGMSPNPIVFIVNELLPQGLYYVEFVANQPLILYVNTVQGSYMNITSNNVTIQYPGENPAYAIIYFSNESTYINSTILLVTLKVLNNEASINISNVGEYLLNYTVNNYKWVNTSIVIDIAQSTPVLPFNITVTPIIIKSLEPTKCAIPLITYMAMNPGGSMEYLLMWSPLPIMLSIIPWSIFNDKIKQFRKYFIIFGIVLMLLFYFVWLLGFLNISPSLYNAVILRVFGILFLIGLGIIVLFTAISPEHH